MLTNMPLLALGTYPGGEVDQDELMLQLGKMLGIIPQDVDRQWKDFLMSRDTRTNVLADLVAFLQDKGVFGRNEYGLPKSHGRLFMLDYPLCLKQLQENGMSEDSASTWLDAQGFIGEESLELRADGQPCVMVEFAFMQRPRQHLPCVCVYSPKEAS